MQNYSESSAGTAKLAPVQEEVARARILRMVITVHFYTRIAVNTRIAWSVIIYPAGSMNGACILVRAQLARERMKVQILPGGNKIIHPQLSHRHLRTKYRPHPGLLRVT